MERGAGPAEPAAPQFKKPVLIGRIGKLPKFSKPKPPKEEPVPEPPIPTPPEEQKKEVKNILPPAVLLKELSTPIPYREPKWSGLPPEGANYSLEVLKSGMIVDTIDLMEKPFHVFGRLANCDVVMAHPTISRHHAILQYRATAEEGEKPTGFYIWDANSTHGTFLNKEKVKPGHYTRVRVGHMIKLGGSTRSYILLGPEWDAEGESELSVTEMKQKHMEMKLERERQLREAVELRAREMEEAETKREEEGVSWGMTEDAEEETDLSDNPYASTANEQLYLDDPKKTLRGYFEREGLELKYDCQEKGPGQFVCRVDLPIDDARGLTIKAEAIHRGKKKEAVVACALEACRLLDRHGLLRQAKHESRRRKERDWSAEDFYDSDEDTFFERTGSVERKRKLRMQRHGVLELQEEKPLTYDDLVRMCSELEARISTEERHLSSLRSSGAQHQKPSGDEDNDPLDQFMSSLGSQGHTASQKADISKAKMEIQKLKTELSKTHRLADIARPANMPELVKNPPDTKKLSMKVGSNSVIYGKRIRLKEDKKVKVRELTQKVETEFVEEVDSDDDKVDNDDVSGSSDEKKPRQSKDDETVTDSDNDNSRTVENTSGTVDNTSGTVDNTSGTVDNTSRKDENISKSDENDLKSDENISKTDKNISITVDSNLKADEEHSKIDKKPNLKNASMDVEGSKTAEKRVFGPMRPPENYVVPESYFEAESDRDLPEIMEDEQI